MPTSKTQICNMALAHVGVAATIQDVDTENSVEAENCRLFFDHCVQVTLEMKEWKFCSRRVALSQITNDRTDQWGYAYKVPNFARRINYLVNQSSRTPGRGHELPYETADLEDGYGKALYTDELDAVLCYNYDVTDVNLFPATFVHALSLFLASNIAMPLRVSSNIKNITDQMYGVWNGESMAQDMQQVQPDQEPNSEFVAIRG